MFDEVEALKQKVAHEENQYSLWQQDQHKNLTGLEDKLKASTTPQEQERLRREVALARADEAQLGTEELIAAELVFNHADEDRLSALEDNRKKFGNELGFDTATRELTEIRGNYHKALKLLAALEKLRNERHLALAARLEWERERIVAQQPPIPGETTLTQIADRAHQLLEDAKLDEAVKAFGEVGREYTKLLKSAQYAWRARNEAEEARTAWQGLNGANRQAATAPEAQMREGLQALNNGQWSTATGAFIVAREQFATLSMQAAGHG